MKSRIVLWGTQGENDKILLGIELVAVDNKVLLHVIPEKAATEVLYNLLMNTWREGGEVDWPEERKVIERPLTASEPILPEDIKVQRGDVIQRAQSEWHFVVLSAKLKDVYDSEIAEIREKIKEMSNFDGGVWEELKGFWDKVQGQIRERNLFRGHANNIKKEVNELFDELKKMRAAMDDELKEKSEEIYQTFSDRLDVIEEKIDKGLGLQPLFNDLKKLQQNFRNSDLVRKHQNKLWKRIDKAFKEVKKKRFGDADSGGGKLSRLENRYDGLTKAINRMKSSIGKDKKDIEFEERRIGRSDGQLEAQLRTAKLKMIQERINSKQVKLDDMIKTEAKLRDQIEKEKARVAKEKKIEDAKAEAKEKIAAQVEENKEKMAEVEDKLQNAVEKVKSSGSAKKKNKAKDSTKEESPETERMNKVIANASAIEKVLKSDK